MSKHRREQIPAKIVIVLVVLSLLRLSFAEANVSGVVRDASGGAVAHASIEAIASSSTAERGTVGDVTNPWMQADEKGKFAITLRPGRYRIRGKAEENGYPDPLYWLNSDPSAVFPEITVGQNGISGVRVVLGRKGGTLEGRLLDRESRGPVLRAKITIRDAHNPDAYVDVFSKEGGFFKFVVASKPIIISVSAVGYKSIFYAGGAAIVLSGGEHRDMTLTLERE